jgi:hypothetical protein
MTLLLGFPAHRLGQKIGQFRRRDPAFTAIRVDQRDPANTWRGDDSDDCIHPFVERCPSEHQRIAAGAGAAFSLNLGFQLQSAANSLFDARRSTG